VWRPTPVISVLRRQRQEGHESDANPGKVSQTLSQKQKHTNKRDGDRVQVVELLPWV
jgi:hypothetical protein